MKNISIVAASIVVLLLLMSFVKSNSNLIKKTRYGQYVFSVGYQGFDIQYNTIEIDGMEYAVFGGESGDGRGGVSVAVVNLTKDKLEVELLKKQIKK